MKLIFVCLFLVSITLATEGIDLLQQLDASEFGRSIIDSLQMHMETGDPVLRFKEIMSGLENMIEAEQKDADKKNGIYQQQCDVDIQAYQTDNNLLLRRLVEIQTTLDSLKPQLDKKQETFKQKSDFRNELQSQLDELNKQRKIEAAEFKQRSQQYIIIIKREHDYAAYVIETVKHIFTDGSPNFLEVDNKSNSLKKVSDALTNAVEQASSFAFKKSYSHIFKVLAQVTSRITSTDSSPFVQRVLDICDQLLQNIEESRALETKSEQVRVQNYTLEKALFDKDIGNLNTQIDKLQGEILQLQDRITKSKRDQSDSTERQGQKAHQIEDRQNECQQSAYNYSQARAKRFNLQQQNQRDENRQIVSQIIGIFSANQRDFQTYINTRQQAGDFEDQSFQILKPGE